MQTVLDPAKETVLSGWRDNTARLEVRGKSKDGLIVHVSIGLDRSWTVSHIGSGKYIAAFKIEFSAYAFAEQLLGLADWTMIAGPEHISDELQAEVRSVGAMFRDCSLNV